jgi:ribonuclease Z
MPGQTNSSFLVRAGQSTILIDSGPAVLQQLAAVGVSPGEITHVFYTHRHGDHMLGYPMLMLWWAISAPKDLYWPTLIGSEITMRSLGAAMRSVYGAEIAILTESAKRIMLPQTEPSTLQLTPAIRLRTWPMQHSKFAPDLGVRIETEGKALAFTGDTLPCENIVELACNADLLVHDSSYSATLNPEYAAGVYGHSTAQICARNARDANVKHLALVHIDAMYQGKLPVFLAEAEREFPGRVSIPTSGTLFSF